MIKVNNACVKTTGQPGAAIMHQKIMSFLPSTLLTLVGGESALPLLW